MSEKEKHNQCKHRSQGIQASYFLITMADVLAALNAAIALANQHIDGLVQNGLSNGNIGPNFMMPLAGRIDTWMNTLVTAGANPVLAPLDRQIMVMSGANAQNRPADRCSLAAAVCIALARNSAQRTVNGYVAGLNRAEVTIYDQATHGAEIHAAHRAEVTRLLLLLLPTSERFLSVLCYNSIMISKFGHCHQAAKAGKLFRTTLRLSPVNSLGDEDPDVAERLFHDAFHHAGGNVLTAACRHPAYKAAMERLGYSNLSRRMPVKEADTAIALNYVALYETAQAKVTRGTGVPANLAAPPALAAHIQALSQAANPNAVAAAAAVLRADSEHLRGPALYLAGYILGCLMYEHDNPDMTLKEARRSHNVTILGSFFIARESGSATGMRAFDTGKAQGMRAPTPEDVAADAAAFIAEAAASVAAVV